MNFMSTPALSRHLDVATRIAHQVGAFQVRHLGRPASVRTKRSSIDLVTEIDRESERRIYRALARQFPDHGFYGEEATRAGLDAPFRWVVDPLDGTMNFVHGVPTFAVSIALVHQGSVLAGLIYDPTRRETFTARHGAGARLNGRRIRVSRTRRLAESLLSTGFASDFRRNPRPYLHWFKAFQSRCHGVRRIGCTTLSLAYVACGRQDGFYEQHLWPWDIAAGLLLVEEAGGRVTDFRGHPVQLTVGQVAASNGPIHERMLALLSGTPA